ncbi:hypothetical protein F7725_001950 [Dissostichus mawsoni]|uniref:Nucleoside diphosphate kinase B n=1 Tax=Dissostichus mawsoni TaxID=36200 RepID=A0A7J5Y210_DISMA|nr:hypothetical protein F7725_001950 [Dissostichus mawsoni]
MVVQAEADSIDTLEKYRGKCEPTFLFYGGGELVAVLRGANAPLLQRIIVEELAKEKLVLETGVERKGMKVWWMMRKNEEKTPEQSEEEDSIIGTVETCHDSSLHYQPSLKLFSPVVPASKSYTVAIIKPDAVAHGKANELIMKIQDAGFEILAQEERTLTEAEARDFYQHQAEEACFEELVQFMSSGPSHVLVLSQVEGSANVVPAWREYIGPADIEEARREKPESLRAQYGTQTLFNAVHGSEDNDQASRELAFFFPNFRTASATEQDGEEERVERTLALIRPDVAREKREEILAHIHKSGFTVALQRDVLLTEEQVRQFYFQHVEEDYFPALLRSMTSGPVLALALGRTGAVYLWKNILGPSDVNEAKDENPECLRAQFAVENEPINQLHGSESLEVAEQEINFFFPKQKTLAVIKPDAMEEHRDNILQEIRGSGFSVTQLKEAVLSRDMAEEFYKEQREKPFFKQLVEFMCRKMQWRSGVIMGPTDPEQAKETSPDSLRARFASDILHNSVHGSSNEQHAEEKIRFIFGDICSDAELTADGGTNTITSEKLSEDHQVGGVQREAHVGCRDGENSHAGLSGALKPITQQLPISRGRGAVNTDKTHIL